MKVKRQWVLVGAVVGVFLVGALIDGQDEVPDVTIGQAVELQIGGGE